MACPNLRGYLTIVPRGFESTTSSIIKEALASFICVDLCILKHDGETEDIGKLTDQLKQQQRKKRSKKLRQKKCAEGNSGKSVEAEDAGEGGLIVGTQQRPNGGAVSIGYHEGRPVLSVPGPVEGVALLQFYTDAPAIIVATIRGMGCGPLLALAVTSCDTHKSRMDMKGGTAATSASCQLLQYDQSLEEAAVAVTNYIRGRDRLEYVSNFRRALSLWHDHAKEVWFANDGSFYGLGLGRDGKESGERQPEVLQRKFKGYLPFTFRVSCLRSHTKRYDWKREDIIPKLADVLVPADKLSGEDLSLGENSGVDESKDIQEDSRTWRVSLQQYDFEVLTIFNHNTFTVAIPLRPYQHLSTKNYSSGKLPPDIAPPYIAGSIPDELSVVRLRPSTAAQLLHLANVQPGDVVLDPCGGIGTIPIEASLSGKRCLGLGGDCVLTEGFVGIASRYISTASSIQSLQMSQASHAGGGVSDMLAWDATLLPVRDSCVDCIISDLPFGVKCLSSTKLSGFLPLLLSECARVLRPGVGRCVFLCGSYQGVLDAIAQNSVANSSVFELPCSSVFPVNIGGLTAWIVIVKRGIGKAVRIANQSDRARKITSIRNRAIKSLKVDSTAHNKQQTSKAKKRRIQS